jgi:DedD protein
MANNQPSEQEIQFRKRARRRLIGAIALVLLMVTVLPMVLDDQDEQAPQPEIAISIPSQEGDDFTSRVVPVPVEAGTEPDEAAPAAGPTEQAAPVPAEVDSLAAAPAAATEPSKPVETETAAVTAEPTAGAFVVQIGVYADAANVKKLQDKLAAQGVKTYTENLTTASGNRIRLRMGPFATRAEAEQGAQALKAAGITGMVVAK